MADKLTNINEHLNPYDESRRNHVPAAGDVYADKSPSFNGSNVLRLVEKNERGLWRTVDAVTGEESRHSDISDDTLKSYYLWIQNPIDEVLGLAKRVAGGEPAEVAGLIGAAKDSSADDSGALMRTESPEHIKALLDASERIQDKLQEVTLVAKCMIETRKRELDGLIREMNGYVSQMKEKVGNILKVITVLNLYTGNTVEVNQITEGEPAPPDEPLSLRQRILFMDEELCVHLDHEADYQDVPAFFEWLSEPENRDVIAPERRCAVCLKPKRFRMDYRSGDPVYDAARNTWNKHTYVVIRNGDNLFWLESEDLEVWEWAFPHEDFEMKFAERMMREDSWKERILKEHDEVTYRVTKYMMFLQGLLDQRQDLVGPLSERPNLMKLQGVRLIRDDEKLIGTGRKPWNEFRDEKNRLIRRGTRILYIAAPAYTPSSWRNSRETDSGKFLKYYQNVQPEFPGTGLYHAEEAETVVGYKNREPVKGKYNRLVFKYLPGDTLWNWTEGEHDRKNRVSWVYSDRHVLNYDAVTLGELQEYLEDRTLRNDFASMIPTLVRAKLLKLEEKRDEDAFKELLSAEILKETGSAPSAQALDEAVSWWKSKVIFTRPLRSDDRKAWKMVKSRILNK